MKLEDQVKSKLVQHPQYRERHKKVEFMARWLHNKYPTILGSVEKLKTIEDMVDEVISVERYWRKVLQENPELRGSDYQDKARVEQKVQIGLGYEPGYVDDIKKLETL